MLEAAWVMKLMLEVTEDAAGATEAVAGSELMRGVGREMVIPGSIITLGLVRASTIFSWISSWQG